MKFKDTNSLPDDVQRLFESFTATEVIETFEMLDLMMVSQGVKREFSPEFEQRYEHTFYLLKRFIRALDPEKKQIRILKEAFKE